MKRIKLFILTLTVGCFIISCSKDALDLQQNGVISGGNFWNTEADAVLAANALYEPATGVWNLYGRGFFWYINASDDMVTGRTRSEAERIKNFQSKGGEGWNNLMWSTKYQIIKTANEIIANVPNMEIDANVKNRTLGEAYFMAGLNYFELAYRFGDQRAGIPIMDPLNPTDFNRPRAASVEENYAFIAELLEKAADLLPTFDSYNGSDYGRAHKTAALAYLAKTYLYWAQYDSSKYALAVQAADRVINSGVHSLITDNSNPAKAFRDVFTVEEEWGSEYIWSVNSSTNGGCWFPVVMFENKGWGQFNGWGYFQPTHELFESYETGDARRDVTIFKEGTIFQYLGDPNFVWTQTSNNLTGYMFGKYIDPFANASEITAFSGTDLNVPLMRYAEVLLIKAEALIADGLNGDEPLNQVRTRAGLAALNGATMDNLKRERRNELAGEWADRHFDLVRWGDAENNYAQPLHAFDGSVVWPSRSFNPAVNHVWPLPPAQIDASGGVLVQNEGY